MITLPLPNTSLITWRNLFRVLSIFIYHIRKGSIFNSSKERFRAFIPQFNHRDLIFNNPLVASVFKMFFIESVIHQSLKSFSNFIFLNFSRKAMHASFTFLQRKVFFNCLDENWDFLCLNPKQKGFHKQNHPENFENSQVRCFYCFGFDC